MHRPTELGIGVGAVSAHYGLEMVGQGPALQMQSGKCCREGQEVRRVTNLGLGRVSRQGAPGFSENSGAIARRRVEFL